MGLFKLLTFPVTGPLGGTVNVAELLLREAERELYDEEAIRAAMETLGARRELGEIGEEEFDRQEEALWERLLAAREYHRRRAGEG